MSAWYTTENLFDSFAFTDPKKTAKAKIADVELQQPRHAYTEPNRQPQLDRVRSVEEARAAPPPAEPSRSAAAMRQTSAQAQTMETQTETPNLRVHRGTSAPALPLAKSPATLTLKTAAGEHIQRAKSPSRKSSPGLPLDIIDFEEQDETGGSWSKDGRNLASWVCNGVEHDMGQSHSILFQAESITPKLRKKDSKKRK